MRPILICTFFVTLAAHTHGAERPAPPPQPDGLNVIWVTIDGLRWQELFGGFDPMLADLKVGGVTYPPALANQYARDSAEESRRAIMPFFWDVIAARGQVFGDRGKRNIAILKNPIKQSYPGYAEMLCGFVEPKIRNNAPIPNPNVTVLEWLNTRPGFESRVAAYNMWDRAPAMLNQERSKLRIVAGWSPIPEFGGLPLTEREKMLNDLLERSTRMWPDASWDALTCEGAMEYFIKHKPRVFWVGLGEVDEWGHERRYDLYLQNANRSDAFLKRLWETAQKMEQYAGKTTLVVCCDHGRGATPADWTLHGPAVKGAEGWWVAVMGPGIAALGVRGEETGEITAGQIAATLAQSVGEDWSGAEPRAAAPLVNRSLAVKKQAR